jgi:2-polyprenyl-3-methyl-5-hydroxy-6-metoxy-1,4-benzoquinol methylase
MAETRWNDVYRDRGAEDVSWFQREPSISMRLLQQAGLKPDRSVIDVGGGASVLVDRLLSEGARDVTVLDVAESALQLSRDRLGSAGDKVTWLVQDVLDWHPSRTYDIWHDRAVFHFLTNSDDRARYTSAVEQALAPDGHMVIATFADDGPTHCSGLPVARYTPSDLAAQFSGLRVVEVQREEHHTPWDTVQPFTWLLLSRAPASGR